MFISIKWGYQFLLYHRVVMMKYKQMSVQPSALCVGGIRQVVATHMYYVCLAVHRKSNEINVQVQAYEAQKNVRKCDIWQV